MKTGLVRCINSREITITNERGEALFAARATCFSNGAIYVNVINLDPNTTIKVEESNDRLKIPEYKGYIPKGSAH
jgi:hypothetical protein